MRAIGKLLQWLGLALLPLAIVLELPSLITLEQMLAMAAAGFAAFWIGRILEAYAK